MTIIPIITENHRYDQLLIILDKSNLDRMQRGDPAGA